MRSVRVVTGSGQARPGRVSTRQTTTVCPTLAGLGASSKN